MPSLIIIGYVWQILGRLLGASLPTPHPWAAPKMPILNRVNELPQYYHLASSNYDGNNARHIGRIVDVFWATLCLIVSQVIIEGGWKFKFFFFLLSRGVGIMFHNNCREYSQCFICSTSECGKILNYKGLRLTGLIIHKWDLKSGACLLIPNLKFYFGVSLLGNVYC